MKRKKLPNNKHNGLSIYCSKSKCDRHFSWTHVNEKQEDGSFVKKEPHCGITNKKLSSCRFYEKHKFITRIHIPGTYKGRKSKTLDASNYVEAVVEAIEFENEFKKEFKVSSTPTEFVSKRCFLINAQARYIEVLSNINVPDHKKKVRSKDYISEEKSRLKEFNEALVKNGVNKRMILIDRITDHHVGIYHTSILKGRENKNRTYNNKVASLKRFFNWAIKYYKLKIVNPFDEVNKRAEVIRKDTITGEEYKRLLAIISPERGIAIVGLKDKQRKQRYKLYLKDGIELALHTGGRREEIVVLKWNMIKSIKGELSYIEMSNLKVERQLGEGFNENVALKIIPITRSLLKLLYRMGYEKYKDSD
ncbi:hypothetical protein A8C32_04950 [Flavivirga aquatica]|uniref:Core-binding (CB) domain-containing protein n=1 Tax=Flavivirga aquatica TaxID=1849968 RepID=A0A1E5SHG7_9FLAO|nr:hypothetical protein [Flavivirga aquatica]OEJ98554.1 hypothetical protein A8C32_04950 [Flavivirga aquatica]